MYLITVIFIRSVRSSQRDSHSSSRSTQFNGTQRISKCIFNVRHRRRTSKRLRCQRCRGCGRADDFWGVAARAVAAIDARQACVSTSACIWHLTIHFVAVLLEIIEELVACSMCSRASNFMGIWSKIFHILRALLNIFNISTLP